MTRPELHWSTVWRHTSRDLTVFDAAGNPWHYALVRSPWRNSLHNLAGEVWTPEDDETVWIDPPEVPEPPDGTRIEFEHNTDVYAAWRDDESSGFAGWATGDGGITWCLYGQSLPISWAVMWLMFGDSLRTMVRLTPVAEDVPNYGLWPTARHEVGVAPDHLMSGALYESGTDRG